MTKLSFLHNKKDLYTLKYNIKLFNVMVMKIMAGEEVIDNGLVDKFDAEDTIFNNCMNDFSEFPAYITGHDDIIGPLPTKFMNPAFKNLNVDSVFRRENNVLVNIEHHSSLNSNLMRRDYNYLTTLVEATKSFVEPVIFNTGPIPSKNVEYANDTMFYNPSLFNTQEIRGIVNLNNLRYKIMNKEELTQQDALDLIWLVKTNIDIDYEELLHELSVEIWAKAVAPRWILDAIRKNLILWAKKYLTDKIIIKEFKEALNMSKIEIKPFEEQIRIAGIAGELERAEEKGRANGLKEGQKEGYTNGLKEGQKEGQEEIISNMLKKYTPEEVSKMTDIPLKRILNINIDS